MKMSEDSRQVPYQFISALTRKRKLELAWMKNNMEWVDIF
jgi:hypothetical protein